MADQEQDVMVTQFLTAIYGNPNEADATRAALADWLEERGREIPALHQPGFWKYISRIETKSDRELHMPVVVCWCQFSPLSAVLVGIIDCPFVRCQGRICKKAFSADMANSVLNGVRYCYKCFADIFDVTLEQLVMPQLATRCHHCGNWADKLNEIGVCGYCARSGVIRGRRGYRTLGEYDS